MNTFVYDGPVMCFDRVVNDNWKASTKAESPQKARSNLSYRFKREHGFLANAKIILPGEIKDGTYGEV